MFSFIKTQTELSACSRISPPEGLTAPDSGAAMTRMALLEILDEMSDDDFERFKWFLEDSHIPRHKLQSANRTTTIDLMIGKLTMDRVMAVVQKALVNIQRNDLAEEVQRKAKSSK